MQQGGKASVTLFRYDLFRFISLLYNGSARIGLLARRGSPVQLGGPFRFCAFALLSPCGRCRPRLLGSLEIALKRTRPRQRFWILLVGIL